MLVSVDVENPRTQEAMGTQIEVTELKEIFSFSERPELDYVVTEGGDYTVTITLPGTGPAE
ncbi:MAG TPA: hypothetical protein VGQ58_04510 [Candidatus Limnocylindrales bacterium]|jgi:hypothetical protein|nr:hypothetical protein [Candidatus Limnocylindrales bacterium]